MTPEKKRIAIAKACGWRTTTYSGDKEEVWELAGASFTRNRTTKELPDYLNDLNAMHEAVLSLPVGGAGRSQIRFTEALLDICGSWPDTVNATSAQRADAFLYAIGVLK